MHGPLPILPTTKGASLAALVFGLSAGVVAHPHAALAAGCIVPNALLHDRCISNVTVMSRARGSCLITFVSACASRRRALARPDIRERPKPGLEPAGSCFVFNGERVCE